MRLLKGLAIGLTVLLGLALGLVGYFYATAKVTIEDIQASGMQASGDAARFEAVKAATAAETFEGTRFTQDALGSAEDYAFITYTVRVSNQCLVPIDMIEVQIVPESGDVLQIGDYEVRSLNAKSRGDISATILTAKESQPLRNVIVTYYVWGVSFTVKGSYGR